MTWNDDLADLRWHWGDAYDITIQNGIFRATRRDDGATVTAPTAEQLEAEIRADYRARPVPRDLPAAPPRGRAVNDHETRSRQSRRAAASSGRRALASTAGGQEPPGEEVDQMNCQSAGSYPGSHAGERPATVLIVYPTGMQEPACDDCARYWVNLRPWETRLAPLASYVDYYAQARAQLDASQAAQAEAHEKMEALRAAFEVCPEDVLRRIAEGHPRFADWRVVDMLGGLTEHEADQNLANGTYRRITVQVHGNAVAGTPTPMQIMASTVLDARKPAVIKVTPQQVSSPPRPPAEGQSRHATIQAPRTDAQRNTVPKWVLIGAPIASIAIGITCCCLANMRVGEIAGPQKWYAIPGWDNGRWEKGYWAPIPGKWHIIGINHGLLGLGIFLIAMPVVLGIISAIVMAIKATTDAHRSWISQHPTWQQAQIRRAEKAAAWGATAVAAVALHEHNKRVGAQLSASVIGTGPPPGKAGAAMWQAKQRRRAEAESQQRQQELLGAVRQSSQPAPDPTATALGRSRLSATAQRRRKELGW